MTRFTAARASDFLELVRRYGGRVAVRSRSGVATYAEIGARAAALAGRLRDLGVGPGDNVAVFLRNGVPAVWTSFGIILVGACDVELNAGLSDAERRHCLSLTPARAVVTESTDAAAFEGLGLNVVRIEEVGVSNPFECPPIEVDEDAFCRINFTSGTTGFPKAIPWTHRRRWTGHLVLRAQLPRLPARESSILLVTPFSHGAGLYTHAYLSCGASVTLLDGMDMSYIEDVLLARSVDALFAPPTVLAKLAEVFAGKRFDCLSAIFCGTAALSPTVYAATRAIFGPVVTLTYGKTEVHSPIALLPADETDHFYTSGEAASGSACLGWPGLGVEADIIDADGQPSPPGIAGEVRLRACHMSDGWIDADGLHAWPDGRHSTGDVGYFDELGRLRLVGRTGDVIKTGGYKIFPAEIEVALAAAGADAVALGVPSTYWGEIVVAVSEKACDGKSLDAAITDALAAFKRPRAYLTVSPLPRNVQGKVVRRELLKLLQETYALVDGPYPRFEPR